jgi:hypothetical protein
MIRKLDKAFLSPLLGQHGFKKKGLAWNHGSGDIVHVLDFQISKFSGPDRIDFTINLGIWMRPLWMVYTGKQTPAFIKESDCWPSYRVGQVLADFRPDAKDLWWVLTNEDEVERVGVEVGTIVSDKCLPFLSRFRSLEDVKRFYETVELRLMPGGKLYLAILSHLLGDRAAYDRLMADFTDKKLSAWQPKVAEVTQRLQGRRESVP